MEWTDILHLVFEIVTALATLGATTIALYLALRDQHQQIDCVFMWEAATEHKPTLILNNIGNRTVIVERIDFFFDGKRIGYIDLLRSNQYGKHAIICPNAESRIDLSSVNFRITGRPLKNPDTIYKWTAVVTSTTKKKYKSNYRYTYNDISFLTFYQEFL